ncbi:MAG TPA: hypothetical protein VII58_05950 [Acidobacteriaceae bacterium]
MSGLSEMSADRRNKAIAVAVFVLLAAGILYYELFAGGTPNPAAYAPAVAVPAASATAQAAADIDTTTNAVQTGTARTGSVVGNTARRVGGSSAALDPALRMDGMLVAEQVEYSGVGRNIFSPNSAPPIVIPRPVASARPVTMLPQPPVRTGPPPPPPIDLTFFGTETDAAGKRLAILLHQDTVYTAQAGDIVLRRYRILSVDARSLQVEDMLTNNKQTLPLVAN